MQAILLCVAGCFGLYEMTKALNNSPGALGALSPQDSWTLMTTPAGPLRGGSSSD
jgi:hypothetical protein